MLIGIKSGIDPRQLASKLTVIPPLLELHLWDTEVADVAETAKRIRALAAKHPGMRIMLHSPFGKNDTSLCIDGDYGMLDRFSQLVLCDKQVIGAVMHPENSDFHAGRARENIRRLRSERPEAEQAFYYENVVGRRTRRLEDFKRFIQEFGITKVTIDLAHASAYHSQQEIESLYAWLKEHDIATYTHISDNIQHSQDTRPKHLGEGNLDLSRLAKLIDFGVIETYSSDELQGIEIKQDYERFLGIQRDSFQ